MEAASADILIRMSADVTIDAHGLFHLLDSLTAPPRPQAAIGLAFPDPRVRGPRYRASAWQLRCAARLATLRPRDAMRAEGSLYGMWRPLYTTFRHRTGAGSIHDDVELARYLVDHGIPTRTPVEALVYKIPAGTLKDFFMQTHRWFAAAEDARRRSRLDVHAAVIEAARDPIGCLAYVYARMWSARERRRRVHRFNENWDPAWSTKH
jgi:hypothetical protein